MGPEGLSFVRVKVILIGLVLRSGSGSEGLSFVRVKFHDLAPSRSTPEARSEACLSMSLVLPLLACTYSTSLVIGVGVGLGG